MKLGGYSIRGPSAHEQDPDGVVDGLERYIDATERAEELDAKIEKTDDLIDEIVYELYGLTDEEIEIVESAVAEWPNET